VLGLVVGLLVGLSGCTAEPKVALFAETASFDLSAGEIQRLMVGVSDKEGNSVTGGEVTFRLRRADQDNAPWSSAVPAKSIPIPGRPFTVGEEPSLTKPAEAVGVYATGPVTIPEPGYWEVEVDAGSLGTAVTAFEAFDKPRAVAVGSRAPLTQNPTTATPGIKPAQLNSLALDATSMTGLPHPELHRTEIAKAIEEGRPLVVIVATPAYCQSQFCGPLVDTIASRMSTIDGVDAVLLEVYPDGYDKAVSPHAAQWISEGGTANGRGNEPWVFTVDRQGVISGRWDNVVDLAAFEDELQRLAGTTR
jgi:hypothetical protein